MIIRIPATSYESAMTVSSLLYELSRPPHKRNEHDVTKYQYEVVQNGSKYYLRIDTDEHDTFIDTEANEDDLPYALVGLAPSSEINTVRQLIKNNKGKRVKINKLIPKYWLDKAIQE